MGAGRKTETYTLAPDGQSASGYGTMHLRNLKKGDLCGVILGCKFSTIKECYAKNLFGLPAHHLPYIKNIDPGLTLFLFNYSDRTLHGIFEAASEGKLNIDPKAWSPNGTDPSPYPAQVKVRARVRCEPLPEEKFRPIIAENYMDEKIFWFELDRGQTNKLLRLFSPLPSVRAPSTSRDLAPQARKPIPASSLAQIGEKGAAHVDKWSSLFKSPDDSGENKGKDSKEGPQGKGLNLVNLGTTRGWETAAKNGDERKAQPSMSQLGASFSSVLRNKTDASTLDKKILGSEEVKVNNAYRDQQIVHPAQKGSSGTASKGNPVEDTYSEIDWDATSSFKVHLDGLNRMLEEPKDTDCLKSNTGLASSAMVPYSWEDEKISWDTEERNTAKSPCGSSYVSAVTGEPTDDIGRTDHIKTENGSSTFVFEILSEILSEIKELKRNQMKQADRMITLEMELLESKREILWLKGGNPSR